MFNEKSSIVKNYVLLINAGEKAIKDVPDFQNLREVIENVLSKSN